MAIAQTDRFHDLAISTAGVSVIVEVIIGVRGAALRRVDRNEKTITAISEVAYTIAAANLLDTNAIEEVAHSLWGWLGFEDAGSLPLQPSI